MKLTHIAIRNFKSIKQIQFDIDGNILGIYGPNGVGKTTIIDAVNILKDIVAMGFQKEIPYSPCRTSNEIGTSFEIEISRMNSVYRFGISYDSKGLLNEWLIVNNQEIYKNPTPEHTNKTVLSKQYDEISSIVMKMITQGIICLNDTMFNISMPLILNFISNNITPRDALAAYSEKARNLDLGFIGLELVEETINAIYRIKDGHDISVDILKESFGTQKCIALGILFETIIENNMVLMFDGLDKDLHENIFIDFLNMFKNVDSSTQLFFTAHNTAPLDNFLDPSEILFVKKKNLESVVQKMDYCRLDTMQEDYVTGVYGYIPENTYP